MKKSIKYAGIAAATLLAVAPVAAPVVSNVTTVKADSSDAQQDYQNVENKADDFKTLFNNDQKASAMAVADFTGLQLGKSVDYATFMGTKAASSLAGQAVTADSVLSNPDREAKVTVSAKQVGGSAITDNGDLTKILANNKMPEVEFTVTLNYTNFNGKADQTRVATFKATKDSTADITSVKASYTTPLNVALNSQVTASELTSSANVSIVDQDGNKLDFSNTNPTGNYYYTYNAALNSTGSTVSTDDISASKFVKAGTYYQQITLTAGANLAQFMADYEKDPTSNPIYVNGKVASEGSDFTTTTTPASGDTPASTTVTFVRTVKVADNDSEWTTSSVDGVVTTKSDSSYYTLKNDDNNTVKNRALAKNTAWKADKVRTDQNGNKQYRVATGEWIDANDVTFGDTATTDTGALTDIQSVKGIVKLDNAGFTYFLYNKAGDQLKTRALSGNSSWQVINTAKDSEGNTYYRVATDEWVMQGNGVTFN